MMGSPGNTLRAAVRAAVLQGSRPAREALSLWADLLVALACAAAVPGASRWLPLVPLVLLLPHLADRCVRALPYPPGAQFVPDPLAPDWPQLARGVATLGLQAGATGTPQTLRLAPFYHPDGRARPYRLDFLPQNQTLRMGEPAGPRPHDARLPCMLRPRLPLPVVVGDQPVTLRIAQLASEDRHPPLALFQCAQDPLTQGFLLPLALPLLLLLPCSWRVSLVAAIALLAPPLSRLAAGGVWNPFRRAPVVVRPPPSAALDLLRLWIGALALVRWSVPGSLAGRPLQDPLGFLFWSLMLPLMAQSVFRHLRERRQSKSRNPS